MAYNACARAVEAVKRGVAEPVDAPPIHNIERWWDPATLHFLCTLKAGIEMESSYNSPARNLLLIAFCRTLIELSNVSFHHQSLSVNNNKQARRHNNINMERMFINNARFVLEGARKNPIGNVHVMNGDSRQISDAVTGRFDLVVTSPPYVNRMSYIRELRPYMYWLGFLEDGRAAGDLDWAAIGGTWGVATSRLIDWEHSPESLKHPRLNDALDKIAHYNNKSGKILANYVAKYFEDMWTHFNSLVMVLNNNAELHYIVGNSTFYGVLVPVEQIYAEMLNRLGFENIKCKPIRKRNSKKELFEFDVSALWKGSKVHPIR